MIVGRERELQRLQAFLDDLEHGVGASVVVTGEPGIGKTTLLDWVASRAAGPVVRVTGHEADREIAAAGLESLRRAIERIGAHPPELTPLTGSSTAPGPLAMGNAALAMLDAIGSGAVVVLDDVQWLDDSSAAALWFALRRLRDESVLAVIARRSGSDGPDLVDQHTQVFELHGLTAPDAAALLGDDTPVAVAERCVIATGGNPLGLTELRRDLDAEQLAGRTPLPAELAVGGRLVAEYVRRIRSLPEATQRALSMLAAAGDEASHDLTRALASDHELTSSLAAAEAAGLVDLGATIRVRHPIIRTAIGEAAGPDALRTAHRTLAEVVTDPERRARHLASGAAGPDESIALAVEAAAATSRRRGAPALAASTWQRAADLSTDDEERQRRLVAAATAWWDANNETAALQAIAPVVGSRSADTRAAAVGVRAEIMGWLHDSAAASEMLSATAADIAGELPTTAAEMLMRASLHAGLAGRATAALDHAERASSLAASDPALAIGSRAARALARQRRGHPELAHDDLATSMVLAEVPADQLAPALPTLQALGLTLLAREQWADAERTLLVAVRAARHHGLDGTLNFSSAVLGEVRHRQGRLADALATASVYSLVDGALPVATAPFAMAVQARIEATLGRTDAAQAHGEAALSVATRVGIGTLAAWARAALGRAALATGDFDGAVGHLQAAASDHREVVDPGELWLEGDLGDALLGAGDHRDARRVADDLARRAERSGSGWGRATAERLLGQVEQRDDRLRHAVDVAGCVGSPLELARARLALAELTRDESMASEVLTELLHLGAAPWAERARRLLSVPPRATTDQPITDVLTDAELRVAVAVAGGRSNREAAEELFLSRRTVDAHLRSIYVKLAIRSRSELTAHVVRQLG